MKTTPKYQLPREALATRAMFNITVAGLILFIIGLVISAIQLRTSVAEFKQEARADCTSLELSLDSIVEVCAVRFEPS